MEMSYKCILTRLRIVWLQTLYTKTHMFIRKVAQVTAIGTARFQVKFAVCCRDQEPRYVFFGNYLEIK